VNTGMMVFNNPQVPDPEIQIRIKERNNQYSVGSAPINVKKPKVRTLREIELQKQKRRVLERLDALEKI
jgi:hypothetical protein